MAGSSCAGCWTWPEEQPVPGANWVGAVNFEELGGMSGYSSSLFNQLFMPVSQFYVGTSYSGDTFVYLSSPSYGLGCDNGPVLETEVILNTFTSNPAIC